MGKSLIIKGADFSQVSVSDPVLTWFIDGYKNERNLSNVTTSAGGFIPGNYAAVQGKSLNRIKLYYVEGTILKIGVVDGVGTTVNSSQVREIDFSQDTPNTVVVKEFETINVPNDKYICISVNHSGNVVWKYMNTGGTDGAGFYFWVGQNVATGELNNVPTHDLNISLGFYG